MCLFAFSNSLNYYNTKIKKFKRKAYSKKIVENVSYISIALVLGIIYKIGLTGLVLSKICALFIAFIYLGTFAKE